MTFFFNNKLWLPVTTDLMVTNTHCFALTKRKFQNNTNTIFSRWPVPISLHDFRGMDAVQNAGIPHTHPLCCLWENGQKRGEKKPREVIHLHKTVCQFYFIGICRASHLANCNNILPSAIRYYHKPSPCYH